MEKLDIAALDPFFKDEVAQEPGCQHLHRCFACGVCTATCPVSAVTPEFSPSLILRQILYGWRRELLASPALWHCLGCAQCSFQCPQDVRFLDIIRGLRNMAIREGLVSAEFAARTRQAETILLQLRRHLLTKILADPHNTIPLEKLLLEIIQDLPAEQRPQTEDKLSHDPPPALE